MEELSTTTKNLLIINAHKIYELIHDNFKVINLWVFALLNKKNATKIRNLLLCYFIYTQYRLVFQHVIGSTVPVGIISPVISLFQRDMKVYMYHNIINSSYFNYQETCRHNFLNFADTTITFKSKTEFLISPKIIRRM